MENTRKIIHVDMDAFFAQIEQRDNPEYKNKPVIVGGPINRGVISAASYEAREYGLHSGMPLVKAKRLCPKGIYLPVDMEKYLEESRKIRKIFFEFTPLVEIVGCDEGFLDVTGCEKLFGEPVEIARKIKGKIYEQTNLTSSAGIGPNKFLAKLASSINKPNGLTVLDNSPELVSKIKRLPVSYLWGVGRVTAQALSKMGVKTIGDLSSIPVEVLRNKFGEVGVFMHNMSNGVDNRKVIPYSEPKSIGREVTFKKDINEFDILKTTLLFLSQKVSTNLRSKKYKGNVLTVKLRFSDFKSITRRITLKKYTASVFEIYNSSVSILKSIDLLRKKIRLIGVSVSGLKQSFDVDNKLIREDDKQEKLLEAIEKISYRFGETKLLIADISDKDDLIF